MEKIEYLILRNLLFNDEYLRKVIPFIKDEYFEDHSQKILYSIIKEFVDEFNTLPTKEILCIEVEKRNDLTEENFKSIIHLIGTLENVLVDFDWLINTTEKWCKDRALFLAITESISRMSDDSQKQRDSIPLLLQDALSVSFDKHVGHDYIQDSEERYEYYHREEHKIPFDLEYFNRITDGGISRKTLSVAVAGTGVGKSLFMCHCASASLNAGNNVLYITLEMAEEKIAERIDANLLNVPITDLKELPKQIFQSKINNLAKKTQGTLIIKEYPTSSAHAGHFRSLLNELALKKSFVPDIIFIDYINICASVRYKSGSNVNSYSYVKAIAEEVRGLAVEFNVPIISATQTTRSGFSSSDVELTDTAESFGLPATADFMFALISSEELEELGQILVKQLKNRYRDQNWNKKFNIGIDRSKMRLYDIEQSAQQGIIDRGKTDEEYEFKEKTLSNMKNKFGGFSFE